MHTDRSLSHTTTYLSKRVTHGKTFQINACPKGGPLSKRAPAHHSPLLLPPLRLHLNLDCLLLNLHREVQQPIFILFIITIKHLVLVTRHDVHVLLFHPVCCGIPGTPLDALLPGIDVEFVLPLDVL